MSIDNNFKKVFKGYHTVIRLSENDLANLKKHKRVTGRTWTIDVVDHDVPDWRIFGKK